MPYSVIDFTPATGRESGSVWTAGGSILDFRTDDSWLSFYYSSWNFNAGDLGRVILDSISWASEPFFYGGFPAPPLTSFRTRLYIVDQLNPAQFTNTPTGLPSYFIANGLVHPQKFIDMNFQPASSSQAAWTDTFRDALFQLLLYASRRPGFVEGNAIALIWTRHPDHAIGGFTNLIFSTDYASAMTVSHVVGNEPSSISDRRRGQRWFLDPVDGREYPIDEAVRDGEKYDKIVHRSNADLRGRRDTRRSVRERGDRLWPRI